MDNSTIAAIATPGGRGGIGIIKISGPQAISIAGAIFRHRDSSLRPDSTSATRSGRENNGFLQSHKLYYGHIVDPDNNRILDEVLLSVMKAPRTYTREDVVEINSHGGVVALRAIMALVLKHEARLAEPGEFTKRAFLNGRIDLSQAEAVVDIVNARTEKSLQIATAQVDGRLRKQIESIREFLVEMLTQVDAAIDFPEDVDDLLDPQKATCEVQKKVIVPLRTLVRNYFDAHVLRDGLKVAVVGKPNVGKSSLLNQLVQKNRSIVTSIPGTTRDVIEETVNIKGIPVTVTDTAGLHKTDDPIETLGIAKTLEHVNDSDLVLFLTEANRPLTAEDYQIYDEVKSKPLIIVSNKIDLLTPETGPLIPDSWAENQSVYISALFGQGVAFLKKKIAEFVYGDQSFDPNETIVPNLRHKIALVETLKAAEAIIGEMGNGAFTELIAINIKEATDSLSEILGTNVSGDVLDRIFSQFCIGK